ncbi:MAG TPA: DUF1631 family protein [Burkholderiales bacterium]|nr:DUF1631 family protein [Burkholderiales bacterium]
MSANPTAVLARARELARGRLPLAVAGALAALPNELRAAAAESTSRPEQTILADAVAAVEAHRGAIGTTFEASVLEIFDRKFRPPARAAAAGATDLDSLTLVDDDAIELEIALGRLVRKTIDEIDAEQLAGVGARLGELAVGKPLEGTANPLGPETALEALRRACDAVPNPGPVRMALVNSLQPHVALALRKLYAELNDMLIAEGVLPRIRHQVQRPAQGPRGARPLSGVSSSGAISAGAPAPGTGVPRLPGMPAGMTLSQAMSLKDLMPGATGSPIDVRAIVGALMEAPAASRRYGARMLANPEGSLYARAMMLPAPEALLAQLSQLQSAAVADAAGGPGDLAAVVAHLARGREHPLEQLTGELVAVVFDFMLHDRELPDAVKAELARLQIVAFKAALLDRTFFAKRAHPLRELLTAIAEAGTDPQIDAGPDSRFVAGLRAIVDEVLAGFAEDLAVFVVARERLASLAASLREESEREVAPLAAELADQERGEALWARAGAEIATRIATGAPVFVQHFLTDTWTHVLADAERHGRTGDDGWDARLALVDDLVWSVGPKQAGDVPRFTAMLPRLVPALNRGMRAVDMPAEGQRAFLDELMRLHAALLQAARSKRPLPPPPAAPPPPPPSDLIAAPGLSADARPVLERGAVVEFTDANPPVRAKLTWISPQQTIYLFTARGAAARHVSPADLSAALREGRARLVAEGGAVIDRALAAVVGDPGA